MARFRIRSTDGHHRAVAAHSIRRDGERLQFCEPRRRLAPPVRRRPGGVRRVGQAPHHRAERYGAVDQRAEPGRIRGRHGLRRAVSLTRLVIADTLSDAFGPHGACKDDLPEVARE